jgi:16S rRNA (cytosine967-C5)-methyltransferase
MQLVRGTLEQGSAIDESLRPLLSKGIDSLPVEVRRILRVAAYQILFMERSKERDVVFEAVELVKFGRYRGLAGLVNAVLRKLKRPQSKGELDPTINFPSWLVKRWTEQYGAEEVNLFCRAAAESLPLYLRVNTQVLSRNDLLSRLQSEEVAAECAEYSSDSIRVTQLPKSVRLHQLSSFTEGLFFVQDLSSSIVADIVASLNPRLVFDLCAAPGGKTCAIALSIYSRGGRIVATDQTAKRVALVEDIVDRLKLGNVEYRVRDVLGVAVNPEERADVVLLDAPCSGFGTVGRKIDVRWSKSEDILQELTAIQSSMLNRAADLVTPDGCIVYSTCSIDRVENEDVVAEFLAQHAEFSVRSVASLLPPALCTSEGYYRAWPQRHHMAGAFAAVLQRR